MEIFKYGKLPRAAVDCIWVSSDTFQEYVDLIDIFKWSGRLSKAPKNIPQNTKHQICYVSTTKGVKSTRDFLVGGGTETLAWAESWREVVESNLEPISSWKNGYIFHTEQVLDKNWSSFRTWANESIWTKKAGKELETILKNCKNQCWNCHSCEHTFGLPDINSIVSLTKKKQ